MHLALRLGAYTSLLLCGAIFGFFYAWVCSTMWGLDTLDPRAAIEAMRAMNASVRNIVFAPAFFATSPVLWLTAAIATMRGERRAAAAFAAAGLVYFLGGQVVTVTVNVPLNDGLAAIDIPDDFDAARALWQRYSQDWQFWNQLRTLASGLSLILCGYGLSLGLARR